MLMCILLHLLICTALRAHIIVVEALYKINYYYYVFNLYSGIRDPIIFVCEAISEIR